MDDPLLTDREVETLLRGEAVEGREDLATLTTAVRALRATAPASVPPSAALLNLLTAPPTSAPGRRPLLKRATAWVAGLGLGAQVALGATAAAAAGVGVGWAGLLPDVVEQAVDDVMGRGSADDVRRGEADDEPGPGEQARLDDPLLPSGAGEADEEEPRGGDGEAPGVDASDDAGDDAGDEVGDRAGEDDGERGDDSGDSSDSGDASDSSDSSDSGETSGSGSDSELSSGSDSDDVSSGAGSEREPLDLDADSTSGSTVEDASPEQPDSPDIDD